jgi:hypothetical protein
MESKKMVVLHCITINDSRIFESKIPVSLIHSIFNSCHNCSHHLYKPLAMALQQVIVRAIVLWLAFVGVMALTHPRMLECRRRDPVSALFGGAKARTRKTTAKHPRDDTRASWNDLRGTTYPAALSRHGGRRGGADTETFLLLSPLDVGAESVAETAAAAVSSAWRQYVPLVVSGAVIVDILCGSPLANSVLGRVRPPQSSDTDANGSRNSNSNQNNRRSSAERIDSNKVAQEALQRAQYSLELRQFLQDRQSDADVYRDKQRQLEALEAELERNQARLQDQMDQGKK